MKKTLLSLVAVLGMLSVPLASLADENIGEKINKESNTASRKMKKKAHRAKEAACNEGDAKCAGKKVKHRAEEGSDYMKDKAEEAKDKVD